MYSVFLISSLFRCCSEPVWKIHKINVTFLYPSLSKQHHLINDFLNYEHQNNSYVNKSYHRTNNINFLNYIDMHYSKISETLQHSQWDTSCVVQKTFTLLIIFIQLISRHRSVLKSWMFLEILQWVQHHTTWYIHQYSRP